MSPDDEAQRSATATEQARQAAIKRQLFENDLKWLMADKRGRRLMYDLLARAGVYQGSFTGNSETFFREGRRDVGLQYLREIEALCFEGFVKMLQERSE